jgi:hypothetical protein
MTSVARSSGDISCKATEVIVTCWGSDYVSFDIISALFLKGKGDSLGIRVEHLLVEDSRVIFFSWRAVA